MDSVIIAKGRATIPKAVREHLGPKPGDRVKFFIHPDSTVVLLPNLPVTTLRGMLNQPGAPISIEQMDTAIAAGAAAGWPARRSSRCAAAIASVIGRAARWQHDR